MQIWHKEQAPALATPSAWSSSTSRARPSGRAGRPEHPAGPRTRYELVPARGWADEPGGLLLTRDGSTPLLYTAAHTSAHEPGCSWQQRCRGARASQPASTSPRTHHRKEGGGSPRAKTARPAVPGAHVRPVRVPPPPSTVPSGCDSQADDCRPGRLVAVEPGRGRPAGRRTSSVSVAVRQVRTSGPGRAQQCPEVAASILSGEPKRPG